MTIDPMQHMGLAMKMVFERRRTIERGEALSIAWEALVKTANHHDESKGQFGTLLRWYVRSVMQDRTRQDLATVRQPEKRFRTDGPLVFVFEEWENLHVEDEPSRQDEYDEMWAVGASVLKDKELLVLQMYYPMEWTLREIGLVTGLSKQRAHQIINRAIHKLREAMNELHA